MSRQEARNILQHYLHFSSEKAYKEKEKLMKKLSGLKENEKLDNDNIELIFKEDINDIKEDMKNTLSKYKSVEFTDSKEVESILNMIESNYTGECPPDMVSVRDFYIEYNRLLENRLNNDIFDMNDKIVIERKKEFLESKKSELKKTYEYKNKLKSISLNKYIKEKDFNNFLRYIDTDTIKKINNNLENAIVDKSNSKEYIDEVIKIIQSNKDLYKDDKQAKEIQDRELDKRLAKEHKELEEKQKREEQERFKSAILAANNNSDIAKKAVADMERKERGLFGNIKDIIKGTSRK